MKKVTDISNLSRIGRENRPNAPCKQWDQKTEALTLGIFARFGDLFQNKCKASGIIIYDDDDKYTETFKLWCVKLDQAKLTVEDVARGIKHLEEHIRDSVRSDNEVWPCSYPEFIGHCQAQKERGKLWKSLPKPTLTDEQKKERMKKLRGDLNI